MNKNDSQHKIKAQQVLVNLLNLSIGSKKIEDFLHEFIVCITAFPSLELEPKGAIFLIDDNQESVLSLKAYHNLPAPLQTICHQVSFGHCLCGRAAQNKEILFVDHLDDSHDNMYDGIVDHGHYCVPILLPDNSLLGVFTLYTKANEKRSDTAEVVLTAAAKYLATIIASRNDQAFIAHQEQRYRSITDNVSDAIIMMDSQGLISFWNPAAENIFGYTTDEAIGENLHTLLVPQQYKAQYTPALKEYFQSGKGDAIGKIIEVSATTKSGKEVPVELSLSSLQVKGEWQAVGIIRDISARRALEEEKEKLNQQLRQAQKMEAVGTLAGGIAQDFNNILGAIIGFADMARDEVDAESQAYSDLENILAAGNRAKELVGQILTFSRQKQEEFLPIEVPLVLQEVLTQLHYSAPENTKIEINIVGACRPVLADHMLIHQIIMNICVNAFQALPENGGTVSIEVSEVTLGRNGKVDAEELPPGDYIKMEIVDSGVGMDPHVIDRIFDPFFTTKPQGEGPGMGLSLVYGIVKELGGRVDVGSEPGKGSVFEVFLPVL